MLMAAVPAGMVAVSPGWETVAGVTLMLHLLATWFFLGGRTPTVSCMT